MASTEVTERGQRVSKLFYDLGLTTYYPRKLSIQLARRLAKDHVAELKDIPWYFLGKLLLVLDYRGWNNFNFQISSTCDNELDPEDMDSMDYMSACTTSEHVAEYRFLDIKIAVFLCCDDFLKKLLSQKMFFTRLSVPFAVSDINDKDRLVIQKWAYRGVREDHDFEHGLMQIVSWMRIGELPSSKSFLLNTLLFDESHETFFNTDQEKNIEDLPILSDGLIEFELFRPSPCICSSSENCSCTFKQDITFLVLHGDGRYLKTHQEFLCMISTLVIVIVDAGHLGEGSVIDNIKEVVDRKKQVLIIFTKDQLSSPADCQTSFQKLQNVIRGSGTKAIFLYDRKTGHMESDKVKEMVTKIKKATEQCEGVVSIEETIRNLNLPEVVIECDDVNCMASKKKAKDIFNKIQQYDLVGIKNMIMPLQLGTWQEWSKMQRQGKVGRPDENESYEHFVARMDNNQKEIRKKQVAMYENESSEIMKMFCSAIVGLQSTSRQYYIQWLNDFLLEMSSKVVDDLRNKLYKHKQDNIRAHKIKDGNADDPDSIDFAKASKEMENKIKNISFEVKHFVREISQIFEACQSAGDEKLQKKAKDLCRVVAELFVQGFPLEIIDSKVNQIPLTFVKSIFQYVKEKIPGNIFILSVLGIQSSGKSTLLNAMFGTQFPTNVGSCTEGINAQLIPIPSELLSRKYEYILLLDTRGLRGTDSDTLFALDLRDRDNELATLLFGISDLVLLNMKGEGKTEVDNILQVVIHALLKIKKVNAGLHLDSKCLILHQNVDESSAQDKLRHDNIKFTEKLDTVTSSVAGKLGMHRDVKCFADIIKLDVEKDIIYVANLWRGSLPMATVNSGYSEQVRKVKEKIYEQITSTALRHKVDIESFSTRLQDVWDAIISENFVYCFKNHLEINAYSKLEKQYNQSRWDLNKIAQATLREFKGDLSRTTEEDMIEQIKIKMNSSYDDAKGKLGEFFETDDGILLIEWQPRYEKMLLNLKVDKITATINLLRDEIKIEAKKSEVSKQLMQWEENARQRAFNCAEKGMKAEKERSGKMQGRIESPQQKLDREKEKENEFNELWQELMQTIPQPDINEDLAYIVRNVMREMGDLHASQTESMDFASPIGNLEVKDIHFLTCRDTESKKPMHCNSAIMDIIRSNVTLSIIQEIQQYMAVIKDDIFSTLHVEQTVQIVLRNIETWNKKNKDIQLTDEYKLSMLTYGGRYSMPHYKKMQEVYKNKIDIRSELEEFNFEIKKTFIDMVMQIDQEKTAATLFCDRLTYLIKNLVTRNLVDGLADDIRNNNHFMASKAALLNRILNDLLHKNSFEEYIRFLNRTSEYFHSTLIRYMNIYLFEKKAFFKMAIAMTKNILPMALQMIKQYASPLMMDTKVKTNMKTLLHELEELIPHIQESMKHVIDSLSDTDFKAGMFYRSLETNSQMIQNALAEAYNQMTRLDADIENQVVNQLLDNVEGCMKKCPFCQVLCMRAVHGHENECYAPQHNPACLSGMAKDGKLSIQTCNSLVGSSEKIRLQDAKIKLTIGKQMINFISHLSRYYRKDYVPFKDYKKVYADWKIDVDNSFEGSLYWKWFISRFSKELADHFQQTAPDIPPQWHAITKKAVVKLLSQGN